MPNTTRQELLRYWKQADYNLDCYLDNCRKMADIYDDCNAQYENRYAEFFGAVVGFANIIIKTQKAWRKLRNEKL